jgi:hypothetical protein
MKYKLIDTSHQIVTYECEVEANSEKEAIEKANWVEVSNELNYNNVEVEEINNQKK